jgi:hypothetical protein
MQQSFLMMPRVVRALVWLLTNQSLTALRRVSRKSAMNSRFFQIVLKRNMRQKSECSDFWAIAVDFLFLREWLR